MDQDNNTISSRRDGQATRKRLLDAATKILAQEGSDALTINRVIRVAGVSKGTFLYHFPSRNHLLEAIARYYTKTMYARIRYFERLKKEKSHHPLLAGYLQWYIDYQKGDDTLSGTSPLLSLVMASRHNKELIEGLLQWYRELYDRLDRHPTRKADHLIYLMALDGLFFHNIFQTDVLTTARREQLLERLAESIEYKKEK